MRGESGSSFHDGPDNMKRIHRRFVSTLLLAVIAGGPMAANAAEEAKAMEDSAFWKLIERAKAHAGHQEQLRPRTLEVELDALPANELDAFQRAYDRQLMRANRWDLWGAAYIMNGGCSDDGFKYFRDWLISEGQSTFEQALQAPDSLSAFAVREYYDLESFGYAASRSFARRTGKELDRSFGVELARPVGKEWKESDLPSLFPKLSKKFANR